MAMAKTLADYRPQHDEDCDKHKCAKCKHPWPHRGLGRTCEIAVAECRTTGIQDLCGCVFEPKPCSCGLDALLAAPPQLRAGEADPRDEQQRQFQRLEFALVLAREAGKRYQQSQEAINPKFSDRLLAEADSEFARAIKIVNEAIPPVSDAPSGAQERAQNDDHGAALLPGDALASPATTVPLPQDEPFRVEVDKDGCERCGRGTQWTVACPDGTAIGQSFEDQELAEEIAAYMNQGYRHGCGGE